MGLERKLDEIRSKPEHIRMRYAWVGVVVCMVFVLMIWFFMIKTNFSNSSSDSIDTFSEIQDQFNESGGGELPAMPSIEDYVTTDAQQFDEPPQDLYGNYDTIDERTESAASDSPIQRDSESNR